MMNNGNGLKCACKCTKDIYWINGDPPILVEWVKAGRSARRIIKHRAHTEQVQGEPEKKTRGGKRTTSVRAGGVGHQEIRDECKTTRPLPTQSNGTEMKGVQLIGNSSEP